MGDDRCQHPVDVESDEQWPRQSGDQVGQGLGVVELGAAGGGQLGEVVRRPAANVPLADLVTQRGHALATLVPVHLDGMPDRLLQRAVVVRVDEHCVRQLLGRPGEFGEDEHAVAVDVSGGVLLRHQVHPVTERRHEHDVTGAVQRDQLVEGQRLVQVVDDRQTDAAVPPVDLAHQSLDLVALVLVVLDALPSGRRHLYEHVLFRIEHARLEQRGERPQPQADALGVVEPVDAQQDDFRITEPCPDLAHPLAGGPAGGDLLHLVDVDRDGEHAEPRALPGVLDHTASLLQVEQLMGAGGEVGHAARGLETDQVTSQQALDDLLAPGKS